MLQPGLYEQVINEKIGGELNALPAQRCATAAIDKAEASQVLAQYLAEVAQKGLDDLADKGGDMTAQINLVNQLIQTIEKQHKKLILLRCASTAGQSSFLCFCGKKIPCW